MNLTNQKYEFEESIQKIYLFSFLTYQQNKLPHFIENW